MMVEFSVPAVPVTRLPFTLTETSILAVIPARYHSTRFPGKALVNIAGRPLIEHVYRRASAAKSIDALLVATDDERIARTVEAFGGVACMTSAEHVSGTDRLAEIATAVPCGLFVNVQGDEPLLDPSLIDAAVEPLRANPAIAMGTAARRLASDAEMNNPNMVKVVRDRDGFALYFSRAPIPHGRDTSPATVARVHIGLYVYRRDTLLHLASLPAGPLEQAEALEQLRALEHGIRINVVDTTYESCEVNTPEDLDRVQVVMAGGVPAARAVRGGVTWRG
jgi:3-deoxy-manno-octulosonate cytidylyltransferase (CMP-KDO synthetase)